MDRHFARQVLAAHFAVLTDDNDDEWPSTPPSRALSDLEVDEASLRDHLASVERMLPRRRL